ncbi:MAG TPA: coenzyme F420-0:L-glutamate ligase [Clostridia bacterium]|nr:coenzyme F420-0:L-glutamate ligase [Clostridia bacterium]HQM95761.1 coenzyme F420-0:L-glutamate ligase [Clostridia bacterium]HQO69449.1 coenzyme F420-0:L-glutamate ligase [Clostridia bacterium]
MRFTGVTSRGIITPIFKQGDDLVSLTADSIIEAARKENFTIQDRDIIGVTEAVVARTQGNYATCEQIAADIKNKLGGKDMGIVFPILSRNRFSILLKAIAMSCEKLYIQLSYPSDEVGNALITLDDLDEKGIDPYKDNFTESQFRKLFKNTVHVFTKVDYIEAYKSMGKDIEIIFSNNPAYILNYTKNVLNCDIHSRKRTQRILREAGAKKVYRMDEILTSSVDGSGYNSDYGLLGSNKATESKVKLFPRDSHIFVEKLQNRMLELTGKHVEVMVYGDGCFKDPVGGIWELADPVVSPGYTSGLIGTPNELKMKYFADNEFASLRGEQLALAMKERIKAKDKDLSGNMESQGTTPRRLTDLLGSLCDLTSGSGDRGTPVVLIQGYFTNFATD